MGVLSTVFQRRGLQPAMDGDWGRIFGTGLATATGVEVSIEGSLALPAMWACCKVLSETTAMLPLLLYRREAAGRRTRATDHPLYARLHTAPNGEQTAMEFREMMMLHLASWGNAYAEIELDTRGRVRGLWPLLPGQMLEVKRRQGRLQYRYQLPDGQELMLPDWQVLHFRGLSGDGIVGYSPVRVAMQTIGLGLGAQEYGARWFANNARPDMVAIHPGKLSKDAHQRMKKSWNEDHQGIGQAHRLRILEEGLKLEKIGAPPEEAQFLRTQEFQAKDLARMYRMPPHKIGILDQATFSNIEHQAIEFVTDTIMPWLVRMEQRYALDLLTEQEQRDYYVEHLIDGLLRGDVQARYSSYAIGRQWGWLSINDVRRLENMDPIADGDAYLQPLNMHTVGMPNPLETAPGEATNRTSWLAHEAARLVRRETSDLRRALPKLRRGAEVWQAYVQEHYRELRTVLLEGLTPAARMALARPEGSGEVDVVRRLEDAAAGYVTRHAAAAAGCAADDDAGGAVEALLARWDATGAQELLDGVLGRTGWN